MNKKDNCPCFCIALKKERCIDRGFYLQKISIVEEKMYMNREKKLMLNIAEILQKENLITLDEKMLLTMLIKEGNK